jgi:Domain of unknown function (DUF4331)
MNTRKLTLPLVAFAGLVMAGCPTDDAPPVEESTSGESTTTAGPTTTPMTMTTSTTDPDTTLDDSTTVTAGMTESSTTEPIPGPFMFAEDEFDQYTQVDRKGFPAVNTGLNLLGDKDLYNQASPADDAALMFATNVFESLETLHLGAPGMQTVDNTGLNDDLISLGLEPCVTPPLPMDTCDDQGGPYAIPDVLTIDLDNDPAFPNGRRLEDPVIDIIFAVLLLDLETHSVFTFTDLNGDKVPGPSLNPLENDVAFPGAFPYLAPAN